MSSNLFENFAFRYFDALNSIKDKDSIINSIKTLDQGKKVGIFHSPKYIKLENSSDLKFDYDYLSSIVDEECDSTKYLTLVKQFAEFIRIAEKCFMYNNSDDTEVRVYSEIDTKTSTTIIYFNPCNIDIKLRIAFQDSSINMPIQNSSLMNFIEGKPDDHNDTVQFVQIDLQRNFGKEMKNEYKFIVGSTIPIKDDSDEVLYRNIKFISSVMIFDCFKDIIDNYMMKMTRFSGTNIKVEDVINDGIRIW